MHCGFVLAASLAPYMYRLDFIKVVSPTFFFKKSSYDFSYARVYFGLYFRYILEKEKEKYFMKFALVSSVPPSKQFQTPPPPPPHDSEAWEFVEEVGSEIGLFFALLSFAV